MFKRMRWHRRPRPETPSAGEPHEEERDTGEEEYEAQEEEVREAAPDGMTRIKSDNI